MRALSRLVAIAVVPLLSQAAACSTENSADDAPGNVATDDAGTTAGEPGTNANASPDAAPGEPGFGFRAEWYDDFSDRKLSRVEPGVGITTPAPGIRDLLYSVRWTAKLTIASAGEHAFFVTADDGVRVFVDGKPIIDDWASHPATQSTGKVTLDTGEHQLRVEYFQGRGEASLALEWQPVGGARGPIPEALVVPLADDSTLEGPRPTFTNPVVDFDCPDPGILGVTSGAHPLFAMVCTGGKLPVRLSDDLVSWRNSPGAILPGGKASWSANGGRNWAPEIHRVGATYVAYYTAVNGANVLSIGCASAPAPEGPYTDCGAPLVQDPLGVIDATFFEDTNGKKYLYYKIDGNSQGKRTPIFARELAANGLAFAAGSTPVEVLNNDASTWEGGVVEAPWVIKRGADYFLFYSGNVYDDRYRTGVARAKSPTGPFTKKGTPILGNNASWVGPGHGSVIAVHGRDYFFHHAWPALPNGKNDGAKGRFGLIAPIAWGADGWPVLGTGSSITKPLLWP
ncbi:MAG: glycoside hydrolase, family 43 [Labilithrix sp.]|nr:glycoside hydrolase, family 43 [Labilithrix sp.]